MDVRAALSAEAEVLAGLWHDGWHDAHATIAPEYIVRRRTPPTFLERMRLGLDDVRVVGPEGAPQGFSMMKGDELNQLYVAAEARGAGVAQVLIADAEQRLAAKGAPLIWLACAIGNTRAARFYEKCGWRNVGVRPIVIETPTDVFSLDIWRFEKAL